MESYNIGLLETLFFHVASCPRFIHVVACQNFLFLRLNNTHLGFFWLLWIMLPWIWVSRYWLKWFGYVPLGGIAGSYARSLFQCLRHLCTVSGAVKWCSHICSFIYMLMDIWILSTFWFCEQCCYEFILSPVFNSQGI